MESGPPILWIRLAVAELSLWLSEKSMTEPRGHGLVWCAVIVKHCGQNVVKLLCSEALSAYELTVELNPEIVADHLGMAGVLAAMGRPVEAEEVPKRVPEAQRAQDEMGRRYEAVRR